MADSQNIDWQFLKTLVFGAGVNENVFERWLQPIVFHSKEPTAMLQFSGGPCAVLAPLQAFLIRRCLENKIGELSSLSLATVTRILVEAMCDILEQSSKDGTFLIARVSQDVAQIIQDTSDHSSSKRARHNSASGARAENALVDIDTFHTFLTVETFNCVKMLGSYLEDNFSDVFGTKYDIVSFLYSVVLTKGPDNVAAERQDLEESLIDPVHGHGSQSLINLMLTGVATQNVFDGDKDLCGLTLKGISAQSEVGFLSYLECLRYLEVGENLKSPKWPVWLLGSETHLTVLFSRCQALVRPPSPRDQAKEAFTALDPNCAGFIPADKLQDLMAKLDLVSETEYVELMKTRLDPDSLGIILLPGFLDEFFSEETHGPDCFSLFHYNGLVRGEASHVYSKGEAVILEGMVGLAENNAILQTLQTKWKNISVDWDGGIKPSIN